MANLMSWFIRSTTQRARHGFLVGQPLPLLVVFLLQLQEEALLPRLFAGATRYDNCRAEEHAISVLTELLAPFWEFIEPGDAAQAELARAESPGVAVPWIVEKALEKRIPAGRGVPWPEERVRMVAGLEMTKQDVDVVLVGVEDESLLVHPRKKQGRDPRGREIEGQKTWLATREDVACAFQEGLVLQNLCETVYNEFMAKIGPYMERQQCAELNEQTCVMEPFWDRFKATKEARASVALGRSWIRKALDRAGASAAPGEPSSASDRREIANIHSAEQARLQRALTAMEEAIPSAAPGAGEEVEVSAVAPEEPLEQLFETLKIVGLLQQKRLGEPEESKMQVCANTNNVGTNSKETNYTSAVCSPVSSPSLPVAASPTSASPPTCRRFLNIHLDMTKQALTGHWVSKTLRDYETVDDRFQLQHRFRHWMNAFLEARDKIVQIWKMRKDITGMLSPDRVYKSQDANRDMSLIDWNWLRLPDTWALDKGLKRWHVVCALAEHAAWEKFKVWRGTEEAAGSFRSPRILRLAEIGVFVGETSLYLLQKCFLHLWRESRVLVQYHLIDPWEVDTFGGFLDLYRERHGYVEQTGVDVYRNLRTKIANATALYAVEGAEDEQGIGSGQHHEDERTSSISAYNAGRSPPVANKQKPRLRKHAHHLGSPLPVFEVDYSENARSDASEEQQKIPPSIPGVFLHRARSEHAITRIQALDVLYVDGEHSFHAVHSDLSMFLPITEAAVAGHDFDYYKFPGVTMAVLNAKVPVTDAYGAYGWRLGDELYMDSDTTWWARIRKSGQGGEEGTPGRSE